MSLGEKEAVAEPVKTQGQNATWDDVVASQVGSVFHDAFDDGVRFIILRGPASLCAYVGIPADHPLAGHSYDNIPLDCHGGLTYGAEGKGHQYLPESFYWYGWDYAHCDDRCTYQDNPRLAGISSNGGKRWTPELVKKDSWLALYHFKKFVKLAEHIRSKP